MPMASSFQTSADHGGTHPGCASTRVRYASQQAPSGRPSQLGVYVQHYKAAATNTLLGPCA